MGLFTYLFASDNKRSLIKIEKINIIIEKRLKFTGEGLNKPSNEDFKSSNPINKIKNEIIKPDIYSNLPWPKGCSISGFLQESLKPKIETKEAAASEILLNASAIIATELARIPKINFKPNSTTFKKIPNTPHKVPYCWRTKGFE